MRKSRKRLATRRGRSSIPTFKIKRATLKLICEVANENHPNEFVGLLRAEGDVISELILLPGTLAGAESAMLQLHMKPYDPTIIGSVHSHPTYSNLPSAQDLQFFSRLGFVNIIVAKPYELNSCRAYDPYGNELKLEIVD